MNPDDVVSRDLARNMASLSTELNRQIGLLIHRFGKVETVIIGDHDRIVIPALSQVRTAGGRLRGLRCVHTTLGKRGPSEEDIMDMACLRLDMMSVLTIQDGYPDLLHSVHLIPGRIDDRDW
ncbi:MAG: GTPase HflX, partial [Deltaproteobacteria bacterium]|nr:GTPase HflX [Deltaproteobacteria bacterium]